MERIKYLLPIVLLFAIETKALDKGLCFNTPFPEPFVTAKSYASVVKGTGIHGLDQGDALCHWEASWHTIAQQNASIAVLAAQHEACENELELCRTPPTPKPQCNVLEDFTDGRGGALWKPVSEGDGNPVVLMPTGYCDNNIIEIWDGSIIIERPRQTNCSSNGPRGHWRLTRKCGNYNNNLIVRFPKESDCRTVPNPCQRYD